MRDQVTIATDASGWFKSVSPAFLELIGRPVESLAGVSLLDLVHPLDAAEARQVFSQSGSRAAQVRVFAAGDQWHQVDLGAVPAADGRVTVTLTPTAAPSQPDPSPFAHVAPVPIWSIASALSFPAPAADALVDRTIAGDRVPEQRAAVRASVVDGTPMLELDDEHRTIFVTGPWAELSSSRLDGADAFEELLDQSGQADVVFEAISQVSTSGQARQVQISAIESRRWVQVLPIPSPDHEHVLHALVTIADSQAAGEQVGESASAVSPAAVLSNAVSPVGTGPSTPAGAGLTEREDVPASTPEPIQATSQVDTAEQATDEFATLDEATTPDVDEPVAAGGRRFNFMTLLTLAIGAALAIVLLSKLWPSSDGTSDLGPIDIEIGASEPVETDSGQSWRRTGAAVGQIHGIAALSDGALVAGINGTIVEVDTSGAARSAVSLGGDETSFVSDIATDSADFAWALDAGRGQLFRIAPDGAVTQVPTDAGPLGNARGLGVSPDGLAWIASTATAQVLLIAPDGATLDSISLPGRQPSDIADPGDGTLWIVDSERLEVVHIALDGEVLDVVEMEQFTSLYSPHLAVAGDSLWVTDPELSGVFEISLATGEPTGQRVVLIRPEGVRVDKPIGIAADRAGRLWIADSNGGATTIVDR